MPPCRSRQSPRLQGGQRDRRASVPSFQLSRRRHSPLGHWLVSRDFVDIVLGRSGREADILTGRGGSIEFSFDYGKTAAAAPTAECRASPSTYQVFPSIAQTVCSGQGASFNLTKTPDGGAALGLSLSVAPHGHAYLGVYEIPPEQIVWINQQSPTGRVQVYGGPSNFTVEAA